MKNNQSTTTIIFATLFAAIMAVAVSPTAIHATSNGNDNGDSILLDKAKPDNKPIKCLVKVQVKLFDAVNGTIYNVQLDNLLPQAKQAVFNQTEIDEGDNNVAFMFQYKKGGDDCPSKGDVEDGNVNGVPFVALINSLTKVNKVGIDLSQ